MATINLLPNARKQAAGRAKKIDLAGALKFSKYILIIPAAVLSALFIVLVSCTLLFLFPRHPDYWEYRKWFQN